MTPYEKWYGSKHPISHFKISGSAAWAYAPKFAVVAKLYDMSIFHSDMSPAGLIQFYHNCVWH